MEFLTNFLCQKVPRAGKELPLYYRKALTAVEALQLLYFLCCFFLYRFIIHQWEWFPLLFIAMTAGCLWAVKHHGVQVNLLLYAVTCIGWIGWNIRCFGWDIGVQHFLILVLILEFFNVYDKPLNKIVWLFLILAVRLLLFIMSRQYPAVFGLDTAAVMACQAVNTVAFFLMLACMCIIFSTDTQDTERQLRLKNQILYKEAGTDPLTGLPNRRAMIEQMEKFYKENNNQPFSVAIADIDLFKQVNDTYGHNCGDYTLVKLTELFVQHSMGRYSVCRWGGEEFFFFIPGMNLDEAGTLMEDLRCAVEKMRLEYEGHMFSITITIGVNEFDFASPFEDLLNAADEKLYKGKSTGRNRVET